ncbi:hypothetical protein AAIE21_11190 [Paenibacillus sp. 102]|uniref:hypothetical protein n=1 Tax=Paenibacillus sp. 102 TaxID=3120823 RepID=UPI0031BAEAD9
MNFVPVISESELKRVEIILERAEDLCEEHVEDKDWLIDKFKQRAANDCLFKLNRRSNIPEINCGIIYI